MRTAKTNELIMWVRPLVIYRACSKCYTFQCHRTYHKLVKVTANSSESLGTQGLAKGSLIIQSLHSASKTHQSQRLRGLIGI